MSAIKHNPFPGANAKVKFTAEQEQKARDHFAEIDDRGRFYITHDEHASMIKGVGFSDVSFGGNSVWLRAGSPEFRVMFDYICKLRMAAFATEGE